MKSILHLMGERVPNRHIPNGFFRMFDDDTLKQDKGRKMEFLR
jgi:hypothetical protein